MTVPEKAAVACNVPGQSMSQPASDRPPHSPCVHALIGSCVHLSAASSCIDPRSGLGQGSVEVVGVVALSRLSTCVV